MGRLEKNITTANWQNDIACLLSSRMDDDNPCDSAGPIRSAAQSLGKTLAIEISDYWQSSRRAPSGPIKIIDMFSGCGGMSTGFRALNGIGPIVEICGAVDIDLAANKTYAENHGIQPTLADVAELARSPKLLKKFIGDTKFDESSPRILIGCAPCQGFSSHRNVDGESDARNSLFLDFARIAAKISPDVVVVENVPEILTEKNWPMVVEARKILEKAGYYVHINVHNMAEFGVPQERFRALMLAMKHSFRPPSGFLERTEFLTVRDAIGLLPPVEVGAVPSTDPMHFTVNHRQSTIDTIRAVPKDGGNRPDNVGPACLQRAKQRSGKAIYEDVYGRLYWDRPAITITAYARNPASGRFVHPEQDRGLTIREASLLQGFPLNFDFLGSLDECFRQVGNAVPPAFSACLAMHIVGELLAGGASNEFDKGLLVPVGISFSRMIPSLKNMNKNKSTKHRDARPNA